MAHTDDGGPAFPSGTGGDILGMSLRDHFAAKAMQGLLASPNLKPDALEHDVAQNAYTLADEMLRARAAESPAETQRQHLDTFGRG